MTKRLILLILTSCFLLTGCPSPQVQQLAADGVEAAVQSNNEVVAKLTAIQETAKLRRKAAMVEAARQADSHADGQEKLDGIELKYQSVFDVFNEAERCQAALADGLEALQAAVKAGQSPNMDTVIALYVQVQQAYATLVAALGEVK